MCTALSKLWALPATYPVLRGMISYGIIWPLSCVTQDYLEHGTSLRNADWGRAGRYSFFGAFLMSPVFYGWLKLSNPYFQKKNFKTAVTRSVVEQITYSPLALAYFFFGMSLLEGLSMEDSVKEVQAKFWPTFKVGVIFWTMAQALNFYYVPERNRTVFVSLVSFVWTVYLAHMEGKGDLISYNKTK